MYRAHCAQQYFSVPLPSVLRGSFHSSPHSRYAIVALVLARASHDFVFDASRAPGTLGASVLSVPVVVKRFLLPASYKV